jgi:3-keto-5-aminohexanoate cleavage enzyme
MSEQQSLMITVAPNGARKTRSDHPAIPLSPEELAQEAQQCLDAGACMIHLHVRDEQQGHTLDVDRYRSAIAAIRGQVGDDLIIQVTSEAVGIYKPDQQMQMVKELRPEAVSLAVRELYPEGADERASSEFFHWLQSENIAPQYILYSTEDIHRFHAMRQRGIIPPEHNCVLYVIGRYGGSGGGSKETLSALLEAAPDGLFWSACAFGSTELDCLLAAAERGGHCRVGFENNTALSSGETAATNSALVEQLTGRLSEVRRRPMSTNDARKHLGML